MAHNRHTKSGPRKSQFGGRLKGDPAQPTNGLRTSIEGLQDNLAILLPRVRAVVDTLDDINRLVGQKATLEQRITSAPDSVEENQTLLKRRDRLQSRIDRLYGPIPQVQDDLRQFRATLRRLTAALPADNAQVALLRAEIERLPWPTPPGFNQPLLRPALENLHLISQRLDELHSELWPELEAERKRTREDSKSGTATASSDGGLGSEAEDGEVMTLAQVAECLKVSYQRAAELVRRRILPGFHLGRQVRVRRRDLLDFMARGSKLP